MKIVPRDTDSIRVYKYFSFFLCMTCDIKVKRWMMNINTCDIISGRGMVSKTVPF